MSDSRAMTVASSQLITENHVINWDEATVIARESDRTIWWIMEAVKIRQESQGVMNRDEGGASTS